MHTLIKYIPLMQGRNVMIIGDIVADTYLEGKISRISREAPVLILEHTAENVVPGGSGNAACNAAALGGKVYAAGIIGQDYAGEQLKAALLAHGIDAAGIISEAGRPTITKTRVMAGGQATVRQQVVRIDRESKEPLQPTTEKKLLAYLEEYVPLMAAVVISDYGGGTITKAVRHYAIQACREREIPCVVDSRYAIMQYEGVTIVKQNESEAAAAMGLKSSDEAALVQAGYDMLQQLKARVILITRGPDGMLLFEPGMPVKNIPVTNKIDVYDVTGAGDTVVAAMTLAVAGGASYYDAARLANFAAGVVVKKPGTATTNPAELTQAIGDHDSEQEG